MVSELAALSSNATWLSERTAQLNANKTGLSGLNALTERLLASINVLVTSTSEAGACRGPAPFYGNCSAYWTNFYPAVLTGYNFTNASLLTTAQLQYVFTKATSALLTAAPYSEQISTSDTGGRAPLYGRGTGYRSSRGGVNGDYTRRFFMNTRQDFAINVKLGNVRKPPVPSISPFKQILAVGNGGCVEYLSVPTKP